MREQPINTEVGSLVKIVIYYYVQKNLLLASFSHLSKKVPFWEQHNPTHVLLYIFPTDMFG